MAEYLPILTPGATGTKQASAAITGGQVLVVSGSGTVAPSSAASAAVLGVAGHDAASGTKVMYYTTGEHESTATGAITAGQTLAAAANGTVAPLGAGTIDQMIGVAVTSAANGAKVRWQWAR